MGDGLEGWGGEGQGTPGPPVETRPADVPVSLWVPDRFRRAVDNQGSAPYYLLATVVNARTGDAQTVCIEGTDLFAAVRTENGLGRGKRDGERTRRLILDNPTRTYRFQHPDAWKLVQSYYRPEMLSAVRKELRPFTVPQLAARFAWGSTGGIIRLDDPKKLETVGQWCAAAAHVLTERGLFAGRGDRGPSLYVVTPRMLAEEDADRKETVESVRRGEARGRAFAVRIPGYAALAGRFTLVDAGLAERIDVDREGPVFTATLDVISPGNVVDRFEWVTPRDRRTGAAKRDWNGFRESAGRVEGAARQHPWLQGWRSVGPERRVVGHVDGAELHQNWDAENAAEVAITWRDAGLVGRPFCELTLRWPDDDQPASATLFLPTPGSGETRSLIVQSDRPYRARNIGPKLHWLDRTSFDSEPWLKKREVIIVSPQGEGKQRALPTRRRP